jgi:glycosyltransferase
MKTLNQNISPDISIVTVCFNSENFIETNINSVNQQDYRNIEQIFIDGGSNDSTVQKIKTLSKSNTTLVSEADHGIYNAMNKGLSLARGTYVVFLNSDDFFENRFALNDVVKIAQNIEPDVITSNIRYVNRLDTEKVIRIWRVGKFSLRKLRNGWMAPHPGTFIRRNILNEVGGFDENYNISGDYDLFVRITRLQDIKVYTLNKFTVRMRTGGVSNVSFKTILAKMREDRRVIKSNGIGNILTLVMKNLRKITQFYLRSFR